MKDIEQKMTKVEARTVKGCQDLFPEDMIPRKKVIRDIEAVFEKYGFLPIETPALEHLETLLGAGGGESPAAALAQ